MAKTAYFECFSGASGDMLLGALWGAIENKEHLRAELDKINDVKNHFSIELRQVKKLGITANFADVKIKEETHHHHNHRTYKDIKNIINFSKIDTKAKELSLKIFHNLALAEAKVHGCTTDEVHFHEVGAVDSIVDIVGFSILFSSLDIERTIVSPVNTGCGVIKCDHGTMPVPAPATLELVSMLNIPVMNTPKVQTELLTPTGAAILGTVADEFKNIETLENIEKISYGAGSKDLKEISNVVRFTLANDINNSVNNKYVYIIQCNIDDMSPETYGYIFDKLFETGALDVYLTPIIMKKNRPGNILSVICSEDKIPELEQIIFDETTTFGIRRYKTERTVLSTEFKTVELKGLGKIRVKIGRDSNGNIIKNKPEYEDCLKIAQQYNIPLRDVINLAIEVFNKNRF